jgi:proline iminopeptidase
MARTRTVLLLNVDLHTSREGEGPPLIVHHGGPGLDHTVIQPHLKPLAEQLEVICFDHRGTGRSAEPQGTADRYHIDGFVEDVAHLAEAIGTERFLLMGHSFGGIVATKFALAHPERLTHLILVCAPLSHEFIAEAEAALPQRLSAEALTELKSLEDSEPSAQVMRRSLELLAPLYFHDPARIADLHLEEVRFGPATQAVWDSLEGFDLLPSLPRIQTPTLVVAGKDDAIWSPARAKEAAKALPNGELLLIENSGHYPFVETPETFVSGVLEFLGFKVKKRGLFGRRSS